MPSTSDELLDPGAPGLAFFAAYLPPYADWTGAELDLARDFAAVYANLRGIGLANFRADAATLATSHGKLADSTVNLGRATGSLSGFWQGPAAQAAHQACAEFLRSGQTVTDGVSVAAQLIDDQLTAIEAAVSQRAQGVLRLSAPNIGGCTPAEVKLIIKVARAEAGDDVLRAMADWSILHGIDWTEDGCRTGNLSHDVRDLAAKDAAAWLNDVFAPAFAEKKAAFDAIMASTHATVSQAFDDLAAALGKIDANPFPEPDTATTAPAAWPPAHSVYGISAPATPRHAQPDNAPAAADTVSGISDTAAAPADFRPADSPRADLPSADLRSTDLPSAEFPPTDFRPTDFRPADSPRADFPPADLLSAPTAAASIDYPPADFPSTPTAAAPAPSDTPSAPDIAATPRPAPATPSPGEPTPPDPISDIAAPTAALAAAPPWTRNELAPLDSVSDISNAVGESPWSPGEQAPSDSVSDIASAAGQASWSHGGSALSDPVSDISSPVVVPHDADVVGWPHDVPAAADTVSGISDTTPPAGSDPFDTTPVPTAHDRAAHESPAHEFTAHEPIAHELAAHELAGFTPPAPAPAGFVDPATIDHQAADHQAVDHQATVASSLAPGVADSAVVGAVAAGSAFEHDTGWLGGPIHHDAHADLDPFNPLGQPPDLGPGHAGLAGTDLAPPGGAGLASVPMMGVGGPTHADEHERAASQWRTHGRLFDDAGGDEVLGRFSGVLDEGR